MLFREVLTYCDALRTYRQGSSSPSMDSNCPRTPPREWSGKRADLKKKQRKLEQTVRTMLVAHRARAMPPRPMRLRASAPRESIERLRANVRRIKGIPRHPR